MNALRVHMNLQGPAHPALFPAMSVLEVLILAQVVTPLHLFYILELVLMNAHPECMNLGEVAHPALPPVMNVQGQLTLVLVAMPLLQFCTLELVWTNVLLECMKLGEVAHYVVSLALSAQDQLQVVQVVILQLLLFMEQDVILVAQQTHMLSATLVMPVFLHVMNAQMQ